MNFLYLIRSPARVKLGITWHLGHRLANIDKTTAGKQRLILAVLLPWGARQVEAWLHRRYRRWHAPLRYGSGRSEYYKPGIWLLECVAIMLLVSAGQCAAGLAGFYFILFAIINVFY